MRRLAAIMLLLSTTAQPQPARPAGERPTVLELFTSQGCSSCPPADALLAELAIDPTLLPLGFHVTYWDRLGWKDPFSLQAATARQHEYVRTVRNHVGPNTAYTPQMVVDGRYDALGSDKADVRSAIASARADAARLPAIPLAVTTDGDALRIDVGGGAGRGRVLLAGFDPRHVTTVRNGENGGRTLTEVNVVRALDTVGPWTGGAVSYRAPRPAGLRLAVLLQSADGAVLAASLLP